MSCLLLTSVVALTFPIAGDAARDQFVEPVQKFIERAAEAHAQISPSRREQLTTIADYVSEQIRSSQPVNLTFICTHNSRRSQLCQVWATVAARYHGVPGVTCFSGGTEATACNIRTVRALRRAGLSVVTQRDGNNPRYLLQYSEDHPALSLFSKVYTDSPNPDGNFAAVLCCSDADKKCPTVENASVRIPLHYEDPKIADGTPAEAGRYDERAFEIARDMLFLMSLVSSQN